MFVTAIEEISKFTRPIHTISTTLGKIVQPGTSTLFFVNDQGDAITCRHVAEILLQAGQINQSFTNYKVARNLITEKPGSNKYRKAINQLNQHFNYEYETIVCIQNQLVRCVDAFTGINIIQHPIFDLAILRIRGFQKILYSSHAKFLTDDQLAKQGKSLCRYGFPFPEFSNFKYDEDSETLEWTKEGRSSSPSFPIDGIITRHLELPNHGIYGIEISTPGLRGQSGGPLFDKEGVIYGMQSATSHLHLGFDLTNHEILSENRKIKISNYPFLHAGNCIDSRTIKSFLTQHNIPFTLATY